MHPSHLPIPEIYIGYEGITTNGIGVDEQYAEQILLFFNHFIIQIVIPGLVLGLLFVKRLRRITKAE